MPDNWINCISHSHRTAFVCDKGYHRVSGLSGQTFCTPITSAGYEGIWRGKWSDSIPCLPQSPDNQPKLNQLQRTNAGDDFHHRLTESHHKPGENSALTERAIMVQGQYISLFIDSISEARMWQKSNSIKIITIMYKSITWSHIW